MNGAADDSRRWLLAALALTFAAYAATLAYPFVYDDVSVLQANPRIQDWQYFGGYFTSHVWAHVGAGVNANYFRPMFMVWALLTHTLGGLAAPFWHLSGVLVHLAATALVFRLAGRLGMDVATSGTAALLFGLHPIHLESVAWVCGVTDPMMSVFLLLAFLFYLDATDPAKDISVSAGLAGFFFLLALWSKETAIYFPAVVLVHAWTTRGSDGIRRSAWLKVCLGSAIALVVYLLMRHHALSGFSNTLQRTSWTSVFLTIPSVLWLYLRNLIVPFPLALFYGTPYVRDASAADFWQPALLLIVMAVIILFFAWRLETSHRRRLFFGFAAMVLPLALPVASIAFFGDNDLVHDRYLYVSSIAYCLLVAAGLKAASQWWTKAAGDEAGNIRMLLGMPARQAMLAAIFIVVYFAGVLLQEPQWSSNVMLYAHAVQVSPHSPLAFVMIGDELDQRGNPLAVKMYEHAFIIGPESPTAALRLAAVRTREGHPADAEQLVRRAIALDGRNPTLQFQLAQILLMQGRVADAESTLRAAITRWPEAPGLHFALGIVLKNEKRFEDARTAFKRELEIVPGNPDSKRELERLGK